MKYMHLQIEERFFINKMFYEERLSINKISKMLKRNKSTISRELKRNLTNNGFYFPKYAQFKYFYRNKNKYLFRLNYYQEFTELFLKYFNKRCCGVKNTYNKIKRMNDLSINIPSWRQVYNWINSNKWVIKKSDKLRIFYVKGRKRKKGIFSKFNNKLVFPIWTRPKNVDLRQEYGHWEADFIIGKKENGYANLLTLTERKTRYTIIKKIYSKDPYKCNSELYKIIKNKNLKVKTITIDNGIEFEKIGLLAHWIKCKVYYCEPYASYQKGTVENANGIIRRWWKKGTNFNELDDFEIEKVQNYINNMERELLNWNTSSNLFHLHNN